MPKDLKNQNKYDYIINTAVTLALMHFKLKCWEEATGSIESINTESTNKQINKKPLGDVYVCLASWIIIKDMQKYISWKFQRPHTTLNDRITKRHD